jgi:hypothetical protein
MIEYDAVIYESLVLKIGNEPSPDLLSWCGTDEHSWLKNRDYIMGELGSETAQR